MNILGAIANGMGAAGKTIGTGALAAGKGIADYLNAQAMRQSGLTPEQLQQNPQLAKAAMGNWLGSIGQGIQTGDYTGSRLGYQQEMLTKLQNLQAMKQQEVAKQRQAGFQQAMLLADTPEKQAQVARMFPEYAEMAGKSMEPLKTISGINKDKASTALDEAQAAMLAWKKDNPEAKIQSFGNKVYAFYDDGSYKDTGVTLPPHIQVAGDRLFSVDGTNVTEVGGPRGLTREQADTVNKANKAAWVAARGRPDAFSQFEVKEGDPLTASDDVRGAMGMAINAMQNSARQGADAGFTYVGPDGTVGVARPGQRLPQGAVSPSQFGSMSMPTAFTKTQVASADTVKQMAENMKDQIAPMMKSLGPLAGRWNDLWTGKLGLENQEFKKFKANSLLLSSKLMNMHVGSRGGEKMMEHFDDLIGQAKQDPANLLTTLDAIIEYADLVKSHGQAQQPSGGSANSGQQTLPGGITLDEINREIQRRAGTGRKK